MWRELFRFWWRRDDNSASVLCIIMASYMTQQSRRDIADYMHSLNQYENTVKAGGGE